MTDKRNYFAAGHGRRRRHVTRVALQSSPFAVTHRSQIMEAFLCPGE